MARSTRRQKLQRCLAGLYHDERNRETGRWIGGQGEEEEEEAEEEEEEEEVEEEEVVCRARWNPRERVPKDPSSTQRPRNGSRPIYR